MQHKCAPCTSSEPPTANPPNTTACPNPHQPDREYFNHATTTCQPNTRDWSPCSNCENIDNTCDRETKCWITEDCDDHYHRSPKRSTRLFSPVFPTKAKPRRKRGKKVASTGKPIASSNALKESKNKQDDQKASAAEGKPKASKSSPTNTARKPGAVEVTTSKSKSKSPQPQSPSPRVRRPTKSISPEKCDYGNEDGSDGSSNKSPKLKAFHLGRSKKKIIDWKKPPKIPIKHTATSKARNENWFADCGKYRIKAYRGDWNNLPKELTRDYEIFERFFKYRKPVKKNTSLVKKLVQGKIDLQKPRIDKKPFHKRSPVVPASGEKPKRTSKLKSSQFRVRGTRVNLRKQPRIEVKHTFTSSLRRDLEEHSCDKPQTPTYWHGSAEEIEQLKKKIDERRGQLRNYWKKNGQQGINDSMNNLIIASSNPSIIVKTKTYRSRTRKSNNKLANDAAIKCRNSKGSTPPQMLHQPRPQPQSRPHRAKQPSANDIKIFQRAIAFKVLPLTKSILVSGHGHGRRLDKPQTTIALTDDGDVADTAKWMLPPTIPIRYSLTSMMRQRSTNKPARNTIKASSNGFRVAR